MTGTDSKRIARNAVYLYGRMLLTVGVSLYTTRVVMETLGVSNYGIYGLVGGIVAILGFINGTMAGATQRFLNYEMGIGDAERTRRTFSNALMLHIAIAILVVVLGETVGLWFVNTSLEIAPERMYAANITYQLSILAAVASIVQIPYMASVMAHERMNIYAGMSILNVLLKLGAALVLVFFPSMDTLIIYAVFMASAAWIVAIIYRAYCVHSFNECRFSHHIDRDIFSSMLKFSGWDIYGNLCYTGRVQGTIVILNMFGSTVLNAAGNLTLTVSGTITSFASAVTTAFRPQIIQQYARRNYSDMLTLLNNCARYSFLLMGLLVAPMFIEMDFLLDLWLGAGEVPAYTATFCRISLIAACGELLIVTVCIGIHATGNVKRLSFISGTLYLIELPAMYLLLKYTGNPPVVYCVHCLFICLILFTDTIILKRQLSCFRIRRFWRRGVLVPLLIVGSVTASALFMKTLGEEGLMRAILIAMFTTAMTLSLTYCFGIDRPTRALVNAKIKHLIKRQ